MVASDFFLLDQDNTRQTLSHSLGKWVILYFYPKDDTPGCTKEACGLRDNYRLLQQKNVVILGVSKDSVASHKKFAEKYSLPFPLLSDPDLQVIKAYNSWGEKKFMGKTFIGTLRKTFLINPKGEIAKIYEKVNPITHSGQLLDDLATISKTS